MGSLVLGLDSLILTLGFYFSPTVSVWMFGDFVVIILLLLFINFTTTLIPANCTLYTVLHVCPNVPTADIECTTPQAAYFPQLRLANTGQTLRVTANNRLLLCHRIDPIFCIF